MFGCCCANKKALKNKEQQKSGGEKNGETKEAAIEPVLGNDKNNSPIKTPSDAPMSPLSELSGGGDGLIISKNEKNNDKSNSSSEEGNNNLGGLIMSDGLVGESYSYINHTLHINIHFHISLISSRMLQNGKNYFIRRN